MCKEQKQQMCEVSVCRPFKVRFSVQNSHTSNRLGTRTKQRNCGSLPLIQEFDVVWVGGVHVVEPFRNAPGGNSSRGPEVVENLARESEVKAGDPQEPNQKLIICKARGERGGIGVGKKRVCFFWTFAALLASSACTVGAKLNKWPSLLQIHATLEH